MPDRKPKICAVIAEESLAAAKEAIGRAAAVADLIELRLDYLRDFDFSRLDHLRQLLEEKPLPVILTCRDVEEGGVQKIDDELRYRLLCEGARQIADYCDIEAAHYERFVSYSPDISRLIVSYHDFTGTPDTLERIYEQLIRQPAAVCKIATRANTVTDTLMTFRLLRRAAADNRTLLALAMGEAGLITRLLGPSRGSFLTFGALESDRRSAPGQVSCVDLRDLYRLGKITRETTVTGILGKPVGHSVSPAIHNSAFAARGLDFVYLPIEVEDLDEFFTRFVRPASREIDWDMRGFSVTIPHKVAVIPLLDEVDEIAAAIGAVNTVVVDGDRLTGYNTDASGATVPLLGALPLTGRRCGVIGAGGAARAVVYGLCRQGAEVTIYARDREKVKSLAAYFDCSASTLDALEADRPEILINTTPVGMHGHSEEESPVPPDALKTQPVVYDLIYNPVETRLLREARAAGCQTIGGLDMLIAQAALQFELWTGSKPDTQVMKQAALLALRRQ